MTERSCLPVIRMVTVSSCFHHPVHTDSQSSGQAQEDWQALFLYSWETRGSEREHHVGLGRHLGKGEVEVGSQFLESKVSSFPVISRLVITLVLKLNYQKIVFSPPRGFLLSIIRVLVLSLKYIWLIVAPAFMQERPHHCLTSRQKVSEHFKIPVVRSEKVMSNLSSSQMTSSLLCAWMGKLLL